MDLLSTAPETERISDDVVEDILVWLPVKPLNRFRCVSSSWSSKIANPKFITKHLNLNINNNNNNNNNNNGFLLCKSPGGRELCTVICNSDGSLTEISRFGIPFTSDIFIGFCNGIFCSTLLQRTFGRRRSRNYHILRNPRICLWNPSIRKFKIIVPEDEGFDADAYGFAFHSQNNDFKLLRFGRFIKDGVPSSEGLLVQVYTLSIDSWSWLELQDITLIETSPCLFFNGALHYIAYSQNRKLILCFDVHDHNFREIILPQDYSNGLSLKFERLAVFKGSLALIAFGRDEDEIEVCCIWAMREHCLVDFWTQTHVVPLSDVENFFGCTGSGQLVITKSINQLFSFDPDSQNENNLGLEVLAPVEGLLPLEDLAPLVYTPNLIESLVLLNE